MIENLKWELMDEFEGVYKISEKGGIVQVIEKNGIPILLPIPKEKGWFNQYYSVNLKLKGEKRKEKFLISHLVAKHFGVINPYPEFYDRIDHIDMNEENDHYLNLKWVNQRENVLKRNKNYNPNNYKLVSQFDKDGNLIATYNNIAAASHRLKIEDIRIRMNCENKTKTCHGYVFSFTENTQIQNVLGV